MKRSLRIVPLLVALIVGACGTTTHEARRSARNSVAGDSETVASADSLAAGDLSDGATTGGGTATKSATGRAATGTKASAATGKQTVGAAIPPKGHGWDEKYVYIGMPTLNDLSTFGNAAGFRSVETGDVEADARAIAADINAKGGLLGRQVKMVFYDTKTASIVTNTDAAVEAACTAFTQDNQVVAVVTVFSNFDTDAMRQCLKSSNTMFFASSPSGSTDDQTFSASAPWYHTFGTLSFNRFIPTLLRRLKAENYYAAWDTTAGGPGNAPVKLGLVYSDTPVERRVAKLVEQLFRDAGRPISTSVPVGKSPSDTSGAVLTFKAAQVTHMIVMLPAADAVFLNFLTQAESQGYHPRYAISTPQLLSFHADNAPHAQLVGSMGLGWNPGLDVLDPNDPGDVGGGAADCRAALAKGGQTFAGDHRFALALALGMCDGFHMLSEGVRGGGTFAAASVHQSLLALGTGFKAAGTFAPTGVSATSYALPGSARDVGWVTACECFKYLSPTYPMSVS